MHYHRRKEWEIPASVATPRRLSSIAARFSPALGAAGAIVAGPGRARADEADPSAALYPAKRNPAYTLDRDVTPEKYNLNYNNFYEFSTSKHIDAERAEDASVDDQDRRPGREGADGRHRRL